MIKLRLVNVLPNRYSLCLFLLFISLGGIAADVHVSPSGVNEKTGRGTKDAPYQTINYLFANSLVSTGDVILLHEGVYRETVTVNVADVTIKPFEDDSVVVSGADSYKAGSWQADTERPGVYKMTLNSSEVETKFTQLFVNGQHKQIARFPNNTSDYKKYVYGNNREMMTPMIQKSGFAILLDASKPTGEHATGKVTFSQHDGTPTIPNVTFTDEAIVRGFIGKLRNNIFCYSQDGGNVTRAGDRLVTFKSYSEQGNNWAANEAYSQPEGFGYVMDLSVLDYEGEWFYKKLDNTIYYKPEGGSMKNKVFDIKKRKYAFKINANQVKLEKINVTAATIEVKNANDFTATNCTFTYLLPFHYRRTYGVLKEGIVIKNADNATFDKCYIGHTWGSGIVIEPGSDNSVINNCVIEDIGWMGQFTVSLYNEGGSTKVTQNTFGKASRFHIRMTEAIYAEITDNDFYGAMSMGEDAGSIMFTSTGKPIGLDVKNTVIAYNKIHDMHGIPAYDTDPAGYSRQKVVALYLEDTENYTVHHNLIYNIRGNTYTSKRPGAKTESKGDVMYLGPRTKTLTKKMYYYNNTCWNYDYFLTFWHKEDDKGNKGYVGDLVYKNNLLMEGKSSLVGKVTDADLQNFATKVAADPTLYSVSVSNSGMVSKAEDHYLDAKNADFRLKSSSSFNSGGEVIAGITSSPNPAIGAWEGNDDASRNRVFRAGSDIEIPTNPGDIIVDPIDPDEPTGIETLEDIGVVFPNPFNDEIHVSLEEIDAISVSLRNMNGRVVATELLKGQKDVVLNTSDLPSGIYFLLVVHEEGQLVSKVIK
ncbi:T9SS type A sorting domain-containing protein [Reichenbachiella versicolor]|uniref:T9SS type A sorting domain-containing protein n=1 Tax=Reichenbachiella versicolor TaxID=1821036 RepID=UPI000D6E1C08|nr:T9SS type A sorting domain-containing protein [Reichenbachiella versicolor]